MINMQNSNTKVSVVPLYHQGLLLTISFLMGSNTLGHTK